MEYVAGLKCRNESLLINEMNILSLGLNFNSSFHVDSNFPLHCPYISAFGLIPPLLSHSVQWNTHISVSTHAWHGEQPLPHGLGSSLEGWFLDWVHVGRDPLALGNEPAAFPSQAQFSIHQAMAAPKLFLCMSLFVWKLGSKWRVSHRASPGLDRVKCLA